MKAIVVYFSQTGSTRKIAEAIQRGILEESCSCEVVALRHFDPVKLSDYDLVGLGTPVFYYREPFHVGDFILTLPPGNGQHVFMFCTHGAVVGNTFPSMAEKFAARGYTVVGDFDCYADVSLQYGPKPYWTDGHPDEIDLEAAQNFGRTIVKQNYSIKEGGEAVPQYRRVTDEFWCAYEELLDPEFLKSIFPRLRINMEKCSHCNKCADLCPVGGIDVEADPPRIQDPCICCFYCEKICPEYAIEADWGPLFEVGEELGIVKYHLDSYFRELKKAEAEGKFRFLIPEAGISTEVLYFNRWRPGHQDNEEYH
jgi:flavodoxin/ferredoxin